jgi:hypothetical protein
MIAPSMTTNKSLTTKPNRPASSSNAWTSLDAPPENPLGADEL